MVYVNINMFYLHLYAMVYVVNINMFYLHFHAMVYVNINININKYYNLVNFFNFICFDVDVI